jgi:nucleotide-binding universal stress UspA family protein
MNEGQRTCPCLVTARGLLLEAREMRVLVATDLGKEADVALREGAALAAARDAELAVVHVLPEAQLFDMFEPVRRHVTLVLGWAPEIFVDTGVDHATIVRRAEQWDADTIVLGSSRRSGVSHIFGGVSERVVRRARCDVLVARSSPARGWVLAAIDLTEGSPAVVRAAADETRRRGARLKVVHALGFLELEARYVAQLGTPPGVTSVSDVLCHALREAVSGVGVEAFCELLDGRAVPTVLREASSIGAELVVVGTHGRTGIARIALGSVSERIVRNAPCSVLVARPELGTESPRESGVSVLATDES